MDSKQAIGTTLLMIGVALLLGFAVGCNKDPRATSDNLKPGLNYMQPMKWRMTYVYRVQNIKSSRPFVKPRPSPGNPGIDLVGNGTYEVWMVGPREGEEVRGVKMITASPEPSMITPGEDGNPDFYYYDFAPGRCLPREIQAVITWEFITFERYTYYAGLPDEPYDKTSDIYRRYTGMEDPINSHPELVKVVKQCKKDAKGDRLETMMNCYNYVVQNFAYDETQRFMYAFLGLQAMHTSYRAWENRGGVCDELANVLCSMYRTAGIPARPTAGFAFAPFYQFDDNDKRIPDSLGFDGGGHAWLEVYWPQIGWLPVDPTWGSRMEIIAFEQSPIGFKRKIPIVDYYFCDSDPFRFAMFKDWNYELKPPPVTPDAEKTEVWFVGCTDRYSNVQEMLHGWEGVPGIGGG